MTLEEIRRRLWNLDNYDLLYFEPTENGYRWTLDYQMFKDYFFTAPEFITRYEAALQVAKQISNSNPDRLYRLKQRDPANDLVTHLMAGEVLTGFNPTAEELKYLAKDPLNKSPF